VTRSGVGSARTPAAAPAEFVYARAVRDTVKRFVARGSRTTVGKHLLHAATRPDVTAERFSEVPAWPERIEGFEDLAFLFTSSQLDHGVASLRFDEAAFLYGLVGRLGVARIVEIGRFKGGSTFITATAMSPGSTLVSYDLHVALRADLQGADLDRELEAALSRYDLAEDVRLVVGDSRSVDLPEPGLDLVFIDGDHTYEGAASDLRRWSPLVRPGGHLVVHDAVDTGGYGNVYPGIRRAVDELLAQGDFDRAPAAGTMAHLVRRTP
jgi:predicted O-methyltransferase YrrM